MAETDQQSTAKTALVVVAELVKAAAATEEVRQAGKNVGEAAVTITKLVNNALLPIAAVNYGFDKARAYFADKFASELEEALAGVPEDRLGMPKVAIAGPALQGIAYCVEEPDLKDLYLKLLVSSIDRNSSFDTHPAFVHVISQLDAQEVRLLTGVLTRTSPLSLIAIWLSSGDGWNIELNHVGHLSAPDGSPIVVPRLAAFVDNWIRLGLVVVSYDNQVAGTDAYAWVEERPEVMRLRAEAARLSKVIRIQRGMMQRTAFGASFSAAVGASRWA